MRLRARLLPLLAVMALLGSGCSDAWMTMMPDLPSIQDLLDGSTADGSTADGSTATP